MSQSPVARGASPPNRGSPPPGSPPRGNTVVFVDWDETILPTSWLLRRVPGTGDAKKIRALLTLEQRGELGKTDEMVAEVLERIASTPNTLLYILTNANAMWLCETASALMPRTANVLRMRNVGIFAAREITKLCLVRMVVEGLSPRLTVSFGDGPLEREAVQTLPKKHLRRTVQFVERPSPAALTAQWKFLGGELAQALEVSRRNTKIILETAAE
jgi:hypothetical protein